MNFKLTDAQKQKLHSWFFSNKWRDDVYIKSLREAPITAPHPSSNLLLLVITLLFFTFFMWATFTKLDEVTRGQGRVVPSSDVQVVQNLEGGIVKEILVSKGAIVDKDQILLKIDDTGFSSSYQEKLSKYFSLQAQIARLEAEAEEKEIIFPAEVMAERPDYVNSERALFEARKEEILTKVAILNQQIERKEQEHKQLIKRGVKLKESLSLLQEEFSLTKPLAEKNIVPQIDLLTVKRKINETEQEIDKVSYEIVKAKTEVQEAYNRIQEQINNFKTAARQELNNAKEVYSQLSSVIKASEDKVSRAIVRSPVRGTIKQLNVNTIGGVVTPGMDLVEIVPLGDSLVVEASIKPADIAFVHPGMKAKVKITAYDFSIYGGLEAKLEQISADSIINEQGESFYQIRVRTDKSYLGSDEHPLPIIPGMVASVDIITGKKSVIDYILKPILKARQLALRER